MKLALTALLGGVILAAYAREQDAPAAPPIKIDSFKVERAKLPGGTREWTKLICSFTTSARWTDGIALNYTVLVEPAAAGGSPVGGGSARYLVLTGGLTYMNVPAGKSEAILYLSPSATARYGTPVAATVDAFRGDRQLETFVWREGSGTVGADWSTKYPLLNGILLPIRFTPWIFTDAERSPDLLITN